MPDSVYIDDPEAQLTEPSLGNLKADIVTNTTIEDHRAAPYELTTRRDTVRNYFTDFIGETYYQLGVSSEQEKDELMKGLTMMNLDEQEIAGWEKYMTGLAEQQRISARQLNLKLHEMLATASEKKYISEGSRKKWIKRFKDPSTGYKAKEYFVLYQMPSYFSSWKAECEKRDELMKSKVVKSITKKEVPNIKDFLDQGKFLKLHFDKRKDLNAQVNAAVISKENRMSSLYEQATTLLESAVAAKVMSKDKIGVWLERIFGGSHTPEEIEKFIDERLDKFYIANWTKVRYRYERTEREMDKSKVPQGFRRLTDEQFLKLSYQQKESYVEEAERQLHIEKTNVSKDPEMENLKRKIRFNLASQDWETAEELIEEAEKKAEGEDIYEIRSMKRYLKNFRKDEDKKEQPGREVNEALESMRSSLAMLPTSMQKLYLSAIMRGQGCLDSLRSLTYNRIWCQRHGYLTERKEEIMRQNAKHDTEVVLQEGHKRKGLENIDLRSVDSSDRRAAMRNYDGDWAPTVIHYNDSCRDELLNKMQAWQGHAFDYWTTLIPDDITMAQQYEMVFQHNPVFKKGMRTLKKHGFAFTLHGPPISLN